MFSLKCAPYSYHFSCHHLTLCHGLLQWSTHEQILGVQHIFSDGLMKANKAEILFLFLIITAWHLFVNGNLHISGRGTKLIKCKNILYAFSFFQIYQSFLHKNHLPASWFKKSSNELAFDFWPNVKVIFKCYTSPK